MPPPAPRPLVLMILDGFGVNPETKWNAVAIARMPHYRRLLERFPHSTLDASESFVGLPKGFMGNSEVGHLNIGAGRVVYQDFSLISKAIEDGSFLKNAALCEVMNGCRALHLMGLVSDGGVHSHLSHCLALIDMAKRQGVKKIWIHAFTDGRDTSPTSGCGFVKTIEDYAKASGVARIATILGRFYAMDRDKRWERTEAAYRAIVEARGPRFEKGADYVKAAYANTGDEFIDPGVAADYSGVQEGDGVIFFNFRADRARQLSRAMTSREFREFERSNVNLSGFVCMTPYDSTLGLPYAFEKAKIRNTLGEIVGQKGWKQLRIAETEKYAHVTYFFNGGEEREFPGEKRILVPSPRDVKTYDLKPEMAAREVTEKLMRELESGQYRFLVVNFANPDMVGHTGLMN
ncbi:MAG: 2,3-bisphosphoglycerate-independent phosphoglycerate mutase, partial [Deltaproteobacteria bacterium]|nr:2,3-bisphosphoglycerate-independent phosphoglycerate mutase [Deltaproteobacteria bacterium]